MDKERNLKKPGSHNFYSSQKNKRKEPSPYSISDKRIKKSRFSSPEKQDDVEKTCSKVVEDINHDIPDRSFGDFYCRACNSHMITENIWESHIQGKRHLKNTKKDTESEYEFVDRDAIILPEIKKVKKPIIGLQHCCEMQRSDGKPVYQCFLCSTSIPNGKLLIEHVIGMKHRMAYLKIHDTINYNVITKADLKRGMVEPLVEEFIQKYQDKHGLGKMRVKVAKLTSSFTNFERPHKDDLIHKKNRNIGNSHDDERDPSESPVRRHRRNSYDDDDVRIESVTESPDWRHSRKRYDDDVRNEPLPEKPDWRHSRNSCGDARNESKSENWRQTSAKERDYHSIDKHGSVGQQSHYDKKEVAYSERQFSTQPLDPKVNYEEMDLYASSTRKTSQYEDLRDLLEKKQQENLRDLFEKKQRDLLEKKQRDLLEKQQRDLLEKQQQEDLRDLLEKKRMLEATTKPVLNSANAFEFVFSIIEDLPDMKFLELVLHKVQKMKDPSEAALNMLSKIGKSMFSIVMEKKMDMLTPDLRKKYQSVTNDNVNQSSVVRTATPEQQTTNKFDFQSLLNLIKNPKRENEKPLVNPSFPLQNVSPRLVTGPHQPAYTAESSNFIQNLWQTPLSVPTSSSDFQAIPGLSSGSQGIPPDTRYSYPQAPSHEQYAPPHNPWSTTQRQFK